MKKCPKCNRTYDDSWGVCLNDEQKLVNLKEGEVSPVVIKEEVLKGFGGWLAFYVWASFIMWPISLFFMWVNPGIFMKVGEPKIFFWYDRVVLTAIGIVDIYACYTLLRLRPKGAVLAKGVLLAQIAYQLIWIIVSVILLAMGREPIYSPRDMVGGLLGYAVWYQYFAKSRRIRNTFEEKPGLL